MPHFPNEPTRPVKPAMIPLGEANSLVLWRIVVRDAPFTILLKWSRRIERHRAIASQIRRGVEPDAPKTRNPLR